MPEAPARALLLRRNFGVYWYGGLLSNIGTWLQNVTASILMWTLTGSPLLVGLLNFATFLPVFVFSMPAGALSDRVDRRRVVVVTQAISFVVAVLLTVLTATGRTDPAVLVAVAFVMGTSYSVAKPALSALLPALVERGEVARATAVNTLQFTLGQVAGSALASLLLAVAGPAWAFGVNAATFLAPIAAMLLLRLPPGTAAGARGTARGGVVAGLRFIRATRPMTAVLTMVVLANAATEALRTLAPSITTRLLAMDESAAALIVTAYSAGAVAGILLFTRLVRSVSARRAVATAFLLQCAGVLGVAASSSYGVTLAAAVVIGIGFSFTIPLLSATLQDHSPDAYRGRVMSAFAMAHLGLRPFFALLAGGLAAAFGSRVAMLAFAAFAVVALGLAARVRRWEAGDSAPNRAGQAQRTAR